MESENKSLLYLAQTLNSIETNSLGYAGEVHWLCLHKYYQEKYIREAQMLIDEWWLVEKKAEKLREVPARLIKNKGETDGKKISINTKD